MSSSASSLVGTSLSKELLRLMLLLMLLFSASKELRMLRIFSLIPFLSGVIILSFISFYKTNTLLEGTLKSFEDSIIKEKKEQNLKL